MIKNNEQEFLGIYTCSFSDACLLYSRESGASYTTK